MSDPENPSSWSGESVIATLRSERDAALAELAEAKKKLERDRIRLEAELAEVRIEPSLYSEKMEAAKAMAKALREVREAVARQRKACREYGYEPGLPYFDMADKWADEALRLWRDAGGEG